MARDDAGVGKGQCGHKGRVHLCSRDGVVAKIHIAGGAGVMNYRDWVSEIGCGAARGINAHMAHGTYDDDFLNAVVVKNLF